MLFTNFDSRNRVVTQGLQTSWTKSFVNTGDLQKNYWLYTRIRTKEYKYVGMTKATAERCADYLTKYYKRRYVLQYYSTVTHLYENYAYAQAALFNRLWGEKQCGTATVQYEEGSAYSVIVSVDEELTHKFKTAQGGIHIDIPYLEVQPPYDYDVWTAFEANPNSLTDFWQFKGYQHIDEPTDYQYDDVAIRL